MLLDKGEMKKIGEMWNACSPVEKLKIDDVLVDYLLNKGILVLDVSDSLLDDLVEIVEERTLLEEPEGHKFKAMIERRCNKAKQVLSKHMNEIKECIKQISNIYRYCLQWPSAIDNFISRIEAIEAKMNSIGTNFDFFKERDGK